MRDSPRSGPILLSLLAILLAAPAANAAAPKGWWNRDYRYRTRVVLSEQQTWPDSPAAHVRLPSAGHVKPDGSDLRVVTMNGKEVPRRVTARGPGDLIEIAFPVGDETEWFVYYGHEKARAPRVEYEPDRGLILETRARGPGNPRNWAEMSKIIEGSTRVFGGSYRLRVYDAHNPFGPSDDFVSIYRGFIEAPKAGRYTFFTASDEASFLFVNDRLVAEWPGWHGAARGAWGVFKGTIDLTEGLHAFAYYHVERNGNQVMAAYWQPPGAVKATVIPATAFPGLRATRIVDHEVRGKKIAAAFTARLTDKWGMDNRVFVRVAFQGMPMRDGAQYRWDFGDGVQGEEGVAHHVYLRGGFYDVALTVTKGGESDTCVRTIRVPDDWTRSDRNRPEVLDRIAELVASYPGRRLAAADLARIEFLLKLSGRQKDLVAILREAVEKNSTLTEKERHLVAMSLGRICKEKLRDLDGSVWAFNRAAHIDESRPRLMAQVAGAEAMLELGGDPLTALRILTKLSQRTAGRRASRIVLRRVWLRSGDARMILGDGENALADYRRSLEIAGGAENAKLILKKAAASRAATTLLEEKDLDRAAKQLAEWEWSAPLDRFTGLHRIVKSKLHLARQEPDLAIRELSALVAGNAESEYADQALFLLATIERERGNVEAEKGHLERLRRDYPWSPLNR